MENEAGTGTGEELSNGERPGKMVGPGKVAAAGKDEGPGREEEPEWLGILEVLPDGGSQGVMDVATLDVGEDTRSELESISTCEAAVGVLQE